MSQSTEIVEGHAILVMMLVAVMSAALITFLALALSARYIENVDTSQVPGSDDESASKTLELSEERDQLLVKLKEAEAKSERQQSVLQQLQELILMQS